MVHETDIKSSKKIYDFDTVVNRREKGSLKWNQMVQWNPAVSEDVIPLSVADMEFRTAPEITTGLQRFLEGAVLGYSTPTADYYEAVVDWHKRRHNFSVAKEWIINSPGIVTALFAAVRAYTEPGDGVIIMTPVYYPFYAAIENAERKLVRNPLINEDDRYSIDFKNLDELCKNQKNKLIVFSSPHNPVGRVWTREELSALAEIVVRNDMVIVSDEIHNDLVMPGFQHTVLQTLSDEIAERTVTCTAPSKTFNLAGLCNSNLIIKNETLRAKMLKALTDTASSMVGIIGLEGCRIAYEEGEAWLDQLLPVIDRNQRVVSDYFKNNFPEITAPLIEGTYLQWVNFKKLGMTPQELETFMHMEAEFFTDEGHIFGEEGNGYERINLAAPTAVIVDSLNRLGAALDRLYQQKLGNE